MVVAEEYNNALEQYAAKGAELELKAPELHYGSMCIDGLEYGSNHSNDRAAVAGTFRLAENDVENRLSIVGKYQTDHGVLSWVNEKGDITSPGR